MKTAVPVLLMQQHFSRLMEAWSVCCYDTYISWDLIKPEKWATCWSKTELILSHVILIKLWMVMGLTSPIKKLQNLLLTLLWSSHYHLWNFSGALEVWSKKPVKNHRLQHLQKKRSECQCHFWGLYMRYFCPHVHSKNNRLTFSLPKVAESVV